MRAKSARPSKYTKPALREKLKARIMEGDKGGRAGQWSARKSQLLSAEYKKAGGGFIGPRNERQKDLVKWTKEKWQTKTGDAKARKGRVTERYLPERAWAELTPAERAATDRKKRNASGRQKQFVANTKAAKRARKAATSQSSD